MACLQEARMRLEQQRRLLLRHGFVFLFTLLAVWRVDAAQITVLSSNGVREALVELIPQFEQATGHRVLVTWDGSLNIRKRIDSGETADLVVMPAADIDVLIASKGLTPGSRVDVAKSTIGVAVSAPSSFRAGRAASTSSSSSRKRECSARSNRRFGNSRPGSRSVTRWLAAKETSAFNRSASCCT
jgi:ABC-type molybdate transport system substrate-binding protein